MTNPDILSLTVRGDGSEAAPGVRFFPLVGRAQPKTWGIARNSRAPSFTIPPPSFEGARAAAARPGGIHLPEFDSRDF